MVNAFFKMARQNEEKIAHPVCKGKREWRIKPRSDTLIADKPAFKTPRGGNGKIRQCCIFIGSGGDKSAGQVEFPFEPVLLLLKAFKMLRCQGVR